MKKILFSILFSLLLPTQAWAVCGNNVRNNGEQCDDGNLDAGDGCNEMCFLECGTFTTRLRNGGFEFPGRPPGDWGLFHEKAVPGWYSTSDDKLIEFWGTGMDGIDSYSGDNHIELMGTGPGGVYQYIETVPGTRIRWSVAHRARVERRERIAVSIGTDSGLQLQGRYWARREWRVHSGIYVVPAGQYLTRIQYESNRPTTGSSGNLIDEPKIDFLDVPDPQALADCPESPDVEHQTNGRGRVQLASNAIVTCDPSVPECAGARSFTGTRLHNSQYSMIHVDADSDSATFNSSSATVNLNSGETVTWARLYWMGGFTDFGIPSRISAPPNAELRDTVKFKAPNGSYQSVTGTVEEIDGEFYRGHADVTALVSEAGEYWLADLQASTGRYMMGGWTLVVITSDPTLPVRTISVIDPFEKIEGRRVFSIDDFASAHTTSSPAEFGAVFYDGDAGSTDHIALNGNLVQPANPDMSLPLFQWDLGNSTITTDGYNRVDRSPMYENNFGFDSDTFDVTGLSGGETDIQIEVVAPNDVLLTGLYTFQVDHSPQPVSLFDSGAQPFVDGRPKLDRDLVEAQLVGGDVVQFEERKSFASAVVADDDVFSVDTENFGTDFDSQASCSTTHGSLPASWLALLGLVFLGRRRVNQTNEA